MIKIDSSFINPEAQQHLFEMSSQVQVPANTILLEIGSVCDHLYFIENGILRNYYYDAKGNDITHWFASEGMVVTIPPSFFKRTPSQFRIEALEDMVVRNITFDQMQEAFSQSHQLERFGRLLVTEIMMVLGQKIMDLQTKSAEERYNDLLEDHPDIFQRAKLGHIATYLGITQQSLSRIRANISS